MNGNNKAAELEDRLNDSIEAMIKNVRQGRRIVAMRPLAKELIYTDKEDEEGEEEEEEDKTAPRLLRKTGVI